MSVVLWLIVALVAGIVEAATVSLVSVWLAAGAVCAAVAAGFGVSSAIQCVVFVTVSAALLILTLPVCSKFRKTSKHPTNADMLIGCAGIVTEEINPIQGFGTVKVRGQIWSARSRDDGFVAAGTEVTVYDIKGAHLVVGKSKKNKSESEE